VTGVLEAEGMETNQMARSALVGRVLVGRSLKLMYSLLQLAAWPIEVPSWKLLDYRTLSEALA
jgi:hypothetical protein